MLLKGPPADALLTVKDAARLARRSYDWAWSHARFGNLAAYRNDRDGRLYVSESSLRALMQAERPRARTRGNRAHLRLVVDNTK